MSSDELLETDLTRAGIFVKEGSQVTSGGLDDSGDSSRQGVLGGPGPLVSSLPRALAATMQRPFVGELDISSPKSSSKKAPTVVSGKRGSRSSHLPRATPRKKMPQEKKSLGSSVSKIVLGRKSQACLSGGPVAPDTFPPISGLPGLGKAEKYSLVPVGTKQPRHRIGKTPAVSRTRDSELVAQGDCSRNKEPAPKGQVSRCRPSPLPSPSLHRTHAALHMPFLFFEVALRMPAGGPFNRIRGLLCARCHFRSLPRGGGEGVGLVVS